MNMSLFLLQFFGLMYVFLGLAILFNSRDAKAITESMTDPARPYRIRLVAILPLVFGLIVLLTHHSWNTAPYAILSLFGWIALFKGTFNLLAPLEMTYHVLHFSNKASFYVYSGLFATVIGTYLAAAGFGLI